MPVPLRLSHFGLYVRDLERSIRWYGETLGFRLSDYLPPGNTQEPAAPHGIAWMRFDDMHHRLTLIQYPPEALAAPPPERPSNFQQAAFHLASEGDVERAYESLRSAGVAVVLPLSRGPLYGVLQFYIADPDGNKIELFSTSPGNSREKGGSGVRIEFLSHVGLHARDLERSVRWYEEMLGFRLADRRGPHPAEPRLAAAAPHGIAWLSRSAEHHNLVLVQLSPGAADKPLPFGGRGSCQQVAFEVESEAELRAAHAHLAERGADTLEGPRPQNWSGGMKFYFRDPDGTKLEILTGMKRVDARYGSHYELSGAPR